MSTSTLFTASSRGVVTLVAITGHLLQTPMGLYYRMYMNLHGIGLEHYDPAFVPPLDWP